MSKNIYEQLEKIVSFKTPEDDTLLKALKKEEHNHTLRRIFTMNFDPTFSGFDLPEGAPPYKTDKTVPFGYAEDNLTRNINKLYVFFNDCTKINRKKKEGIFIALLEVLHWREAELLIAVKDKKLTDLFPMLDVFTIRYAFPGLLPPMSVNDKIIAATTVSEDQTRQNSLHWAEYTKEEILRLTHKRKMVIKVKEQAELVGLPHLAFGYVAPEVPYDQTKFLYYTKTKGASVVKIALPLEDLDLDQVRKHKIGSLIDFDNLEQAIELGVGHYDTRLFEKKTKGV